MANQRSGTAPMSDEEIIRAQGRRLERLGNALKAIRDLDEDDWPDDSLALQWVIASAREAVEGVE